MDSELCIINMCQPELDEDISSVIARLTRIEDTIKSGQFVQKTTALTQEAVNDDDRPPMPDDQDAPPDLQAVPDCVPEEPVGFWTDIAAAVRKELKPPVVGFFSMSQYPQVKGVLRGSELILVCDTKFTLDMVNKPDVLALVGQKASAKLGTRITVKAVDSTSGNEKSAQMEQLVRFGKAHPNFINIKE